MFRSFDIRRYQGDSHQRSVDTIAAEEPLAIRLQYWRKGSQQTDDLAITMRTPGADAELAIGLLLTEGVIREPRDVVDIRALGTAPSNEILVELAPTVDFEEWRQRRNGFVSSSCGVCGKASTDQIRQLAMPSVTAGWQVTPEFIRSLPQLLVNHQPTFNQTGGVHAAALISLDGRLVSLFEDIGRHNALDKLIGRATLDQKGSLSKSIIFMSSRSSFELVQKAAMAGSPMLASVGGPSSLAVDTARLLGITLVGFVREQRFNVYSGDWRIKS